MGPLPAGKIINTTFTILPITSKILIYHSCSYTLMYTQSSNINHKTIVVSKKNYDALKTLGHVGDSFDDVIGTLLSKIAKKERIEEINIDV